MSNLWSVDPELHAIRQRPQWGEFHRELGRCNLGTREYRESHGWTSLYSALVQSQGQLYRQTITDGRGPTVLLALADALPRLSTLLSTRAGLRCRLLLAEMLVEDCL